jgi:hypothetical protein
VRSSAPASLSRSIQTGPIASMSAAERDAQWISRRTVCAGQATLVQ